MAGRIAFRLSCSILIQRFYSDLDSKRSLNALSPYSDFEELMDEIAARNALQ
jgi:hypothetical protein